MAARRTTTQASGTAGEQTGQPSVRVRTLLRAAEKVFAVEGYHGATMRQLAEAAGVSVSLLMYHFKSKEQLYYQIFVHRQNINEQRLARLQAVDLDRPDALEEIVAAFIEPVLALHDDPDDLWFARLVLREAADPSSQQRQVISSLFDPMAREFIAALRRVLSEKPEGFHEWAYLFSVGALTQSAFDTRIRNLANAPSTGDKDASLRSFITAALRYG